MILYKYHILIIFSKNLYDDELKRAFNYIDQDLNGKINIDELMLVCQEFFNEVSKKDVERMFKTADTDNDGFIDMDEFTKIVRKTHDL